MSVDRDPDEAPDEVPGDGPDVPQELPSAEDSAKQQHRQQSEAQDDPRTPSETRADWLQQTESGWNPQRKFDAPRKELAEFDLKRAGLPEMTFEEADKYVEDHRDARPWLSMTDKASPEARRIIAALDAAGGHAHIRHEGWVTEEANTRRAAYLEDPAQLDSEKRNRGIDGVRQNDSLHRCRSTATRITNPDVFAVAFVRGIEHAEVQEALNAEFLPKKKPSDVAVPIEDLLGSDGRRYCTGWRLQSVDGSMEVARTKRDDWIGARAEGREPDVPEPQALPVRTFAGGDIVFAFKRNDIEKRYELITMFVRPVQNQVRKV